MPKFEKRLLRGGIDVRAFSSWAGVDELRLVANAVKHADGLSAKKLYEQRPDLFTHPELPKNALFSARAQPRVFMPLLGEDLYVSLEDLRKYRDAVVQFWEELGRDMARV